VITLRGFIKSASCCLVWLQAFTIIGGGRVGQALADMGAGSDVSCTAAGMQTFAGLVFGTAKSEASLPTQIRSEATVLMPRV
jgi:hypothetical protein